MSADLKANVDNLTNLVQKQRALNDSQTQATRQAWDQHIKSVQNPEQLSQLLRELAANPLAW